MKFSELVEKLSAINSCSLASHVSQELEISEVAAIYEATSTSISYIEGERFAAQIKTTAAGALILPKNETLKAQATDRGIAWVEAADPKLMFAQTIGIFYQPFKTAPGIHPTAVIDPSAQVGQGFLLVHML